MIEKTGVQLRLGQRVGVDDLVSEGFDEIILATGISPRTPEIEGIEHSKVVSYLDAILGRKTIGKKVAIIGAGGIGFDTAEFLTHGSESPSLDVDLFMKEWGVDLTVASRGGVIPAQVSPSEREVYLIQRKSSKVGQNLGKTSGWVHRTGLKKKGVHMISGAEYKKVDDQGLHLWVEGEPQILEVDNIILCAGQEPLRELQSGLESKGQTVHLIGGADVAAELDAKRAINQGSRLAAEI
jgi:2,4-dienoyl-CoA reductase (NADPH2)